MRPITRRSTTALTALALVTMLGACHSANGPARRQLLAGLPLDSLIKTLGPDVAKHGMTVGVGSNNHMSSGQFEETYTADFDAPSTDLAVVNDLASKIRDVVARRGGKVMGGSGSGAGFVTVAYTADSLAGLVAIAAIKSDRTDLERFVILVSEVATSAR